jgi:hypothetical protein
MDEQHRFLLVQRVPDLSIGGDGRKLPFFQHLPERVFGSSDWAAA